MIQNLAENERLWEILLKSCKFLWKVKEVRGRCTVEVEVVWLWYYWLQPKLNCKIGNFMCLCEWVWVCVSRKLNFKLTVVSKVLDREPLAWLPGKISNGITWLGRLELRTKYERLEEPSEGVRIVRTVKKENFYKKNSTFY